MPYEDLKNKHILITGASSGIGRCTALYLATLGAKVTLIARRKDLLESLLDEMPGQGHKAYPFDLNELEGIEGVIKQITAEQGKLDGMAFFAGIAQHVPLKMTKPEYAIKVMRINYFAFCETLRCISNARYCNPGASFIGMASVSGMQGDKGLLAYSASKGAMISAIKCAAVELADKKIRVNGIATGYIGGTGIYKAITGMLGAQEVESFANDKQLLGIGKPEYIAKAAAFLLSDDSQYVTGSIMLVDGGYMA